MAAGKISDAAFYFQRLGENKKASPDLQAADLFGVGGRILSAAKNANEYLKLAAKLPIVFGMLARKALGMSNGLNMTIDFKETNLHQTFELFKR